MKALPLLLGIGLTMLLYGAYPILSAKKLDTEITASKYFWKCYGINFLIWIVCCVIAGEVSSGVAFNCWTLTFQEIGKYELRKKGLIIEKKRRAKTNTNAQARSAEQAHDGNERRGSAEMAQKQQGQKRIAVTTEDGFTLYLDGEAAQRYMSGEASSNRQRAAENDDAERAVRLIASSRGISYEDAKSLFEQRKQGRADAAAQAAREEKENIAAYARAMGITEAEAKRELAADRAKGEADRAAAEKQIAEQPNSSQP